MWDIEFTQVALSDLSKIDKKHQKRILKKIQYYASLENPRSVAKPMTDFTCWHWRRRIGDWRVIFDIDDDGKIIIVLVVDHRSKVYE